MQDIDRLVENIAGSPDGARTCIIEGRRGPGRDDFVKSLIMGILCRSSRKAGGCGKCESCRQVEAGTSPDVIYMSKSGKGGTYLTEDAAAFTSRLSMGAYGRHIVGVVDDAELMSEVVQNKMLKTLEEPEPGTIILLVTDNREQLIRTVRSRCMSISCSETAEDECGAAEELMEVWRSSRFLHEVRDAADRKLKSMEDALSFLGTLEQSERDMMLSGKDMMRHADAVVLIEKARKDIYNGMNWSRMLRRLMLEMGR